jgi:hypothetical protein
MREIMVSMSPRQKSALRKGRPVRLKGGDIPLFVDTDNYDRFSKSFLSGKGIQHSMSPAEVAHNEGMGVFKKAKKTATNIAKKVGRQVIKQALPFAGEAGSTLGAAAATASGNPQFAPIASVAGERLGEMGGRYAADKGLDLLRTHKQRANQPRSRGPSQDPIRAANKETAMANMAAASIDAMRYRQRDNQAPSPLMSGSGIHEVGTVGVSGNLISDPAALMSQPYSANFQFRHTLPPAYANISKQAGGRGLYAQPASARGLYAQPASARGLYAGSLGAGLYAGGQGLYA